MSVDHESRRQGSYERGGAPAPHGAPPSALRRFLGGSPIAVFVKLLVLSVIAGAVMAIFGVTPDMLLWRAIYAIHDLYLLGLETFHDFGRWILAGALVVVPLWLISRFMAMGR